MELTENRDYIILPDPNDQSGLLVRIQHPRYEGVVYRYLTVQLVEDAENETLDVNYKYEVVDGPKDIILSTSDFEEFVTAILHDVLYNQPAAHEMTDQNGNRITDIDTPKPSTE